MRTTIGIFAAIVSLCCWLGQPGSALAQSPLERIEDQIRTQPGSDAVSPGPAAPSSTPGAKSPSGERPYLGAFVDDRNDRGRGVRVLDVRPDGPSARAGLLAKDLIVSASGVRGRQMADLSAIVDAMSPGDTLSVEITRNGQTKKVDVVLGHRVAPASPEGVPPPVGKLPVGTPSAPGPDLTAPLGANAQVDQLQRRVEQLERRVEALERALAEAHKAP
jgi:hypothetical protein